MTLDSKLPDDLVEIAATMPRIPRGYSRLRNVLALLPQPLAAQTQPSIPAAEVVQPDATGDTGQGATVNATAASAAAASDIWTAAPNPESYNDFTQLGLLNGAFQDGLVGTLPLGRTASLPYWTIVNNAGTPTLEFLAGGGIKATFAAANTSKLVTSDKVRVLPGRSVQFSYGTIVNDTGVFNVECAAKLYWYKADGSASSTPSFALVPAFEGPPGVINVTSDYATAPDDAYFAAVELKFAEGGTHSATHFATCYWAILLGAPVASEALEVDTLIVDLLATFADVTMSGGANIHWHSVGLPTTGMVADDLHFDSVRNMLFKYDGTRWLCVCPHTAPLAMWVTQAMGLSVTTSTRFAAVMPVNRGMNIWVESVECSFAVEGGGSALSASHKWVGTFVALPSSTVLGTINIDSGASSSYRSLAAAVNALLDITAADTVIVVNWTKTGTPGNLEQVTAVNYRFIGT